VAAQATPTATHAAGEVQETLRSTPPPAGAVVAATGRQLAWPGRPS